MRNEKKTKKIQRSRQMKKDITVDGLQKLHISKMIWMEKLPSKNKLIL